MEEGGISERRLSVRVLRRPGSVRLALWALLCLLVTPARAEEISAEIPGRESHEGSSLLKVENAPLLQANDWKRAFWVALDEGDGGKKGSPLGLLGQKNSGKWELLEVRLTPRADRLKVDDTEALARKGGFIYLVGSHFGKKKGKLDLARQFLARFRESEAQGKSPAVDLDVFQDDFKLHRLLNDALAKRNDLIDRGAHEAEEYIEATRKGGERGTDNVRKDDRALNIEGATFLDSGELALGLRYPVTKKGEPLILVLDDAEALFFHEKLPKVTAVWALRVAGAPERLRGLRALDTSGGEIQAIVGSIERTSNESPILKDHPGADQVTSEHWAFTVPSKEAKAVDARRVRDLAPSGNVEGVAVDDCGDDWYVLDDPAKVLVRHEVHK
jgi:hypothetical protein